MMSSKNKSRNLSALGTDPALEPTPGPHLNLVHPANLPFFGPFDYPLDFHTVTPGDVIHVQKLDKKS